MTAPPIPDAVTAALARYPGPVQARLLDIRAMIFEVAEATPGVGLLTETLKWGEPAYLTEASRSGSTIRLGTVRSAPDAGAVLLNCRTTLVEEFRDQFADCLTFDGTRAIVLPRAGPLPHQTLEICLRAALTYHRRKGVAER